MIHSNWCCCHRLESIGYGVDPHRLRRYFNEMSRTWTYQCLHCDTVWLNFQIDWIEDADYTLEDS